MSISTIWETASRVEAPTVARVLAFAGSLRASSYNKRIVRVAAEGARNAGAAVDIVDLETFKMPLFELEAEVPNELQALAEAIRQADACLIAVPENNWGISAALKNVIDWTAAAPGDCWKNKPVASIGASLDGFGTVNAQHVLRTTLTCLEAQHIPKHVLIGHVARAFNADGELVDDEIRSRLLQFGADLVMRTRRKQASK